jgi:RNase P/RNase MRP subunit p30
LRSDYDLLAIQPASELAFASACTTLECDIITLDAARRLPFKCVAAVTRR